MVEMCMGMGFPVGMGIPWNSRGNGNEKQISMGMGMICVGVGMLEKMGKKIPIDMKFIPEMTEYNGIHL